MITKRQASHRFEKNYETLVSTSKQKKVIEIDKIYEAQLQLKDVAIQTPLQYHVNLSLETGANVFLKREDLQPVRSYKLRGAYHKIASLTLAQKKSGVVCASAGNHAQGVAYACNKLHVHAVIYMPVTTPKQKIQQVKRFGKEWLEIILSGDTFDDSSAEAKTYCEAHNKTFIHPFDDATVIAAQGTVGLEILEQTEVAVDFLLVPIGGGGLAAGLVSVFSELSPDTKIIGVEPEGAASMLTSMQNKKNTTLHEINKFVDGAAVKRVGELPFEICKNALHKIITVPEGKICSTMLELYNSDAMVVEPAGALSIAALTLNTETFKSKNVVCIVSGSNNDITRMEDIKEKSLLYEGLKHYFLVEFPQRSGALKDLVNHVLSPTDDISFFQYIKKHNRGFGPAVIGIELEKREDFYLLKQKLKEYGFYKEYLNDKPELLALTT